MKILATADIGNSTTEVCLAEENEAGKIRFLSSASVYTTGLKGTVSNVAGILAALDKAIALADITSNTQPNTWPIDHIRINEAAPVIGGAAMETLTQTAVTESSMLGHNPKTPAGTGTGYGITISIENLHKAIPGHPYIAVISDKTDYETAASLLNQADTKSNINITGAIIQADEAVLVYNRLNRKFPIIDEVRNIHKINENTEAAIETAPPGRAVSMLSSPYGIATMLKLTPEETINITPIAKSLIGARSAVVIKTPSNKTTSTTNNAPAKKIGKIIIKGDKTIGADFANGAKAVSEAIKRAGRITDISGEAGTNIGDMLTKAVESMAALTTSPSSNPSINSSIPPSTGPSDNSETSKPQIRDLFPVDTFAPVAIAGGMADETSLEKAIAVAAMVTAGRLPMEAIAKELVAKTGIYTTIAGNEPAMAALGALTTPGAGLPLAMMDLGGGSTDAAILDGSGKIESVSLAGAGELVTMIIQSHLGLTSRKMAENIKRYPAAKVESMFHIRLETGETIYYEEGIDPRFLGSVVLLSPEGLIRIDNGDNGYANEHPMEKIVSARQDAKRDVFVQNALRAIDKLSKFASIQKPLSHVLLVGGSAEDFEIPSMISTALAEIGLTCGRGNIRGKEGPRNAVATGLVMAYAGEEDV